jgi:hypothetical protein
MIIGKTTIRQSDFVASLLLGTIHIVQNRDWNPIKVNLRETIE